MSYTGKIEATQGNVNSTGKLREAALVEASNAHELKCDLAADVIRRFGVLRLRVNGFSMLPSIWPGDVVSVSGAEWGAYIHSQWPAVCTPAGGGGGRNRGNSWGRSPGPGPSRARGRCAGAGGVGRAGRV